MDPLLVGRLQQVCCRGHLALVSCSPLADGEWVGCRPPQAEDTRDVGQGPVALVPLLPRLHSSPDVGQGPVALVLLLPRLPSSLSVSVGGPL